MTLKSAHHAVFRRVGDDLAMEAVLSLREALVGFRRSVEMLDGATLALEREEVTSHAATIEVPQKGMPAMGRPGKYGALHVHCRVEFPKSLSAVQKEKLQQVLSQVEYED